MKEDFLHYLWDNSKIPLLSLKTTEGKTVSIKSRGVLNTNAGPDFQNALIVIDDTSWAGHVEMHIRSSSWYEHHHDLDSNYRNVILHVVWEHDRDVVFADGYRLPVLELKDFVPPGYLRNYLRLTEVNSRVLNCSDQHHTVADSLWASWYEELFFRRMEQRFNRMLAMAPHLRTHWEELLFRAVFRYMGAKVNADSFYSIASAIGIDTVRKMVSAGEDLETVFHGMAGLLDTPGNNDFCRNRKTEFDFLKRKYHLEPLGVIRPVFFRLRPRSFPAIRLSQLSRLFAVKEALFARVLSSDSIHDLKEHFMVSAHPYWDRRYTYHGKSSEPFVKKLSEARSDLILLNAVFPVLYAYYRNRGAREYERIPQMAARIKAENNQVLRALKQDGVLLRHAGDSQALIELYHGYCSRNRCLQCKIGAFIIGG